MTPSIDKLFPRTDILFIVSGGSVSPFVQNDINILKSEYKVKVIHWRNIIQIVRYSVNTKLFYRWFADGVGFIAIFLSTIFKKKSVIITGGYDVAYLPEINYGLGAEKKSHMLYFPLRKYVLKNSTKVLCVSKSNMKQAKRIYPLREYKVIYNCVDTNFFKPSIKKEKVITTAGNITKYNLLVKGIGPFFDAVKSFYNDHKDYKFYIMGDDSTKTASKLKSVTKAENIPIIFTGRVGKEKFKEILDKTMIFVQVSGHESFGVAIAEAMSSGCIPIGSKRFALSEVIGKKDFLVPFNHAEVLKNKLEEFIKMDKKELKKYTDEFRKRVIENFSYEIRRKKLLKIIGELIDEQ